MELLKILLYYPFINLLTFYVWLVPGHNIVWGVILLTITIRLLLLIPSKKQAQSQRKVQQIMPLLEELKKEYGSDREGLARAQMELYKKNGISPFGSCGLVLIQLPILLILYYAILRGINVDSPHIYSWIPRPTEIQTALFGIDLLRPDRTFIIPLIAAALQFIQTQLTLPDHARAIFKKKGTEAPAKLDTNLQLQRNMSLIFPFLTLIVAGKLPGAVAVYWVISTAFSIGQQYFVNREKFNIAGVETALGTAADEHPEAKRTKKAVNEILAETRDTKKGVTVRVRKKS